MPCLRSEIWRPVVGWEGLYDVSNLGSVRSVDRWIDFSDGRRRFYESRAMSPNLNGTGYLCVSLSKNNHCKTQQVHGLVGKAFIDPDYLGDLDHIDMNKTNNRLSNLRKATRSQNNANSVKTRGVSKYKGVHLGRGKVNPWSAKISVNCERFYLGGFSTQEEAAQAYNTAALKHFGVFARTNQYAE